MSNNPQPGWWQANDGHWYPPEARSPITPDPRQIVCPTCGHSDQIRSIATLIDADTSTTGGTAKGSSVGLSAHGLRVGSSNTSFDLTSVSALARRFAIEKPATPEQSVGCAWLIATMLVGAIVASAWKPWPYAAKTVLVIGAIVATLAVLAWAGGRTQERTARHDRTVAIVRSGFYCLRDDSAFTELSRAYRPDDFVVAAAAAAAKQANGDALPS